MTRGRTRRIFDAIRGAPGKAKQALGRAGSGTKGFFVFAWKQLGISLSLFWAAMLLLWGLSVYVGIAYPISLSKFDPPRVAERVERGIIYPTPLPSSQTPVWASELDSVIVYDQERRHYVLWERKEAIKFSLDQVASSINYLFVGAAAILGYVLKILIEPRLETTKAGEVKPVIGSLTKQLLLNAGIGSIISIACGFFARQFLTALGDSATFSIYDEMGYGALGQLLAFFFAAILMICAAFSMVTAKSTQ